MWISRQTYNEMITKIAVLACIPAPIAAAVKEPGTLRHADAVLSVMRPGVEYTPKKVCKAVRAAGLTKRKLKLDCTYSCLANLVAEGKIRRIKTGVYKINK